MYVDLNLLLSGGYRRVGFFGLGRSSLALMRMMPRSVEIILRSDVIPRQIPTDIPLSGIHTGEAAFSDLYEEVLILSPSVRRDRPELIEALARGVLLTSDTELFFGSVSAPVFAVSGSDGKSTTTTLAARLLAQSFPSLRLCGNIGVPMCGALTEGGDCFVCELSSFQLIYSEPRSRRAALTNITPNHLNWHTDYGEYRGAKMRLLEHTEQAVVSVDSAEGMKIARSGHLFGIASADIGYGELRSKLSAEVFYTLSGDTVCRNGDPFIPIGGMQRRPRHDTKNLLTALALSDGYVTREHAERVASSFEGLPHRCHTVRRIGGVEYINSSIDTTPERTAETLRSLDRRVTLMLGGRGKGTSVEPLTEAVMRYADRAILFGEYGAVLEPILSGRVATSRFSRFSDALEAAVETTREGTLLLSPAATSYDEFSDFEERGDLFEKRILSIKCK